MTSRTDELLEAILDELRDQSEQMREVTKALYLVSDALRETTANPEQDPPGAPALSAINQHLRTLLSAKE